MNMRGGILLRTVGRAVGSTTPAASTAACSACTCQVPRPSSLRTICLACQNATLSHQPVGTINPSEVDGWEILDDLTSDNVKSPRWVFSPAPSVSSPSSVCDDALPSDNQDWHVFGLPPTFDEAYVAASELQAAFIESDNHAIDDDIQSTSSSSTLEGFIPQASNKGSDSEQEPHSDEWVEPQLLSPNRAMVQVPKNPVHEAFQLLQNDSNVKAAVIAIASDADVWHAMLKNKKVQELKCIFEKKSQGTGDVDTSPMHSSKDDNDNPFDGIFSALCAIGKMSGRFICQVQDDLSKFIMSILSSLTGAKHLSEKEDPIDKEIASTMMLAVLVITVVILKRLPV